MRGRQIKGALMMLAFFVVVMTAGFLWPEPSPPKESQPVGGDNSFRRFCRVACLAACG